MLEATGLDAARLGTIAPAADVVGALRDGPAAALGLTAATRVVVGTGDEHGASLGAGGIRPGIVIDITGTAEPVCVAATTPVIDETGLVETHAHADPRVWLVENPGFVSGGSVAWFTEAIGSGHAPAQLDAEAAAATRPGADGVTFLPTLSGATAPRWNDLARGRLRRPVAQSRPRAPVPGAARGLHVRAARHRRSARRDGPRRRRDPRRRWRCAQPAVAPDEGGRDRAHGPGHGLGRVDGARRRDAGRGRRRDVRGSGRGRGAAGRPGAGRLRARSRRRRGPTTTPTDVIEPFSTRSSRDSRRTQRHGRPHRDDPPTPLPDPTDLDGLRRRLADDPTGRRRPIGLGTVRIGPDALRHLADDVASVRRDGPVVVLD